RFKNWVDNTNIFQYLGIHYVDIIYFATNAKPIRVLATAQKNYLLRMGINNYDAIQAVIQWQMQSGNTFTSSFFTNWIDPECTSAMSEQSIKVIGTTGRYEADQKKRGIFIVDDGVIEEPNPDFCMSYGLKKGEISYKGYGIDSVVQFLEDISNIEQGRIKVEELEGKRPTFNVSIIPTMVIEAVNKSLSENGQWVELL
ncbi:MAG: gfo/Idh/MocA family oxidoreductase, partial [Nitrospinae bacterium]|nr:gfo/Idh/MocA family oxidoreductase [Nitrospinota bacterium]